MTAHTLPPVAQPSEPNYLLPTHSTEFDPTHCDTTWSQAAEQLLTHIRRLSSPQWTQSPISTNCSTTDENTSRRSSSLGRTASQLVSRLKHYMRRQSFGSNYSNRSQRWEDSGDDNFGFQTISSEIDRALSTTSPRASSYLRDSLSPQDTYEILISDANDRHQPVRINTLTTVAHACFLFDPEVDLRTMQLYEEVPELPGFFRAMEDHELITRRSVSWSSAFSFSRYRMLENRNKYTALKEESVLSDRSISLVSLFDGSTDSEATNLVAKRRQSTPEWTQNVAVMHRTSLVTKYVTSGSLWFRTPHQGWRKLFCFLHGSSVFCSLKRRSKFARDMRLVIDLSVTDIFFPFSSNIALPFRAPTSEVIICKPCGNASFDTKTFTVFAARTAEDRMAWQNGFRIHKFGISRLEKNLELASPPRVIAEPRSEPNCDLEPAITTVKSPDKYEILISDAHDRHHPVQINELTTVAHACILFDPAVDLRTMQLYEEVPELPGFVRAMEDHELITQRCVTWSSAFSFSRYRLLENPDKYTALREETVLSDRSLSLHSLFADSADSDAMNLMTKPAAGWMPKIEAGSSKRRNNIIPKYVTCGSLWFRTPRQGWRKMFCFLHGSSVFCSLKRRSKSARDMRLVIDLSVTDIFFPLSSNVALPFRAPTSEVIICKPCGNTPFDAKTFTVFATRTAEGRMAWLNGFRIHKFGISHLEKNYELASLPSETTHPRRASLRNLGAVITDLQVFHLKASDIVPIDQDADEEASTRF